MKYLKSIVLITIMGFSIENLAQQIFVEIGRVNSNFIYKNSKGENDITLYPVNDFSYAVGYRKTLSKNFYLNGAVIYNKYGAFGSDSIYNNSFRWETGYIGISASGDAEVYKRRGFAIFARVAVEPQFMLSGTQQINGEVYDLRGVEQFDSAITFVKAGAGFNWCSNNNIAFSFKYMYGRGYPLTESKDGESLTFQTGTFNLGMLWSLSNCKYCYDKR